VSAVFINNSGSLDYLPGIGRHSITK
jgi:hypothetical protein